MILTCNLESYSDEEKYCAKVLHRAACCLLRSGSPVVIELLSYISNLHDRLKRWKYNLAFDSIWFRWLYEVDVSKLNEPVCSMFTRLGWATDISIVLSRAVFDANERGAPCVVRMKVFYDGSSDGSISVVCIYPKGTKGFDWVDSSIEIAQDLGKESGVL